MNTLKFLLFFNILLFSSHLLFSASFTSVSDGLWSSPSTWTPAGVPENNDEVVINHLVTLDEDMVGWSHGVSSLVINMTGSLISDGETGVKIDNGGLLSVFGYMNVWEVYFKGSAEVYIEAGAQVIVQTNWTSQGENAGDLDPFVVNGSLTVLGTFEDDGSNIIGSGTITAGIWDLEGTILFGGQTPPGPNQTLFGCTWQGDVSHDWNNLSNWYSNEVPSSLDVAYIPMESLVFPVISSGISATCKEMIMEGGASLTIQPGGTFTSSTMVTNEGTIHILSNSTGTGSFIDGGGNPNPGNGHVQRYLADESGFSSYYIHQVGSPVAGQTLGNYNMIDGRTYAYEYQPATASWNNIWEVSTPMPSTKGIILSTLNNTGDQLVDFYGSLVTGNQTVSLVPSSAPGELAWNLVGNPYPSPIDWDLAWPQANISNVVYIWDPSVPEYKSYVKGTGGSSSCRFIQVGQAFFIGAEDDASTFVFGNYQRVHNNAPFLKEEKVNSLDISLSGGNGTGSTAFVALKSDATHGYDPGQEAEKWFSIYGNEANEIFFVTDDGKELQVAAAPIPGSGVSSASLYFQPATDGMYNLSFGGTATFEPSMKIFLEDRLSGGNMLDLKAVPGYTFHGTPGDRPDRFVLHFGRDLTGINDREPLTFDITVAAQQGVINVYNPDALDIRQVNIFDISGRNIASHPGGSDAVIQFPESSLRGMFIVQVVTVEGVMARKVLIQ